MCQHRGMKTPFARAMRMNIYRLRAGVAAKAGVKNRPS